MSELYPRRASVFFSHRELYRPFRSLESCSIFVTFPYVVSPYLSSLSIYLFIRDDYGVEIRKHP